jgi:hypothetical protein
MQGIEFFFDAERWLTPGTEYAVPEKLPLPREWYRDWDAIAAATNGAARGPTDANIDDGTGPCTLSAQPLTLEWA